jgi:hypothetical protein
MQLFLLLTVVASLLPGQAVADCGQYECDALYPYFLNADQYDAGETSDCTIDPADNADIEVYNVIW